MAEAQFDRLRTQLLELTDRLENHVTDEAQRGTEARLLALSHDFKGTVIVMLEAIAARNQVALLELLNEKVGEDFAKLNEGLTARLF